MPEATEPAMRLAWLVVATLVAAGCGSCAPAGGRDAGDGDVDAARDGGDADAGDGDTDGDTDQTSPDALPPPVPMDLVEVPRDREGMECGLGCRQVTFAAPAPGFDVNGAFLSYVAEADPTTIFLVDLSTGGEYEMDPCRGSYCGAPRIDDGIALFVTHDREDVLDDTLWRYRIGDSERTALVSRRMTGRGRPMGGISVSDGALAWWDSSVAPAGLYAMALDGGDIADLTPERCLCYGYPHLAGRRATFDSTHGGPMDIWLVDIDTLELENLTNHPAPQFEESFDGTWVVWTDGRNDPSPDPYGERVNPDLFGMELSSRAEEPLVAHPAVQADPEVRDGMLVWEDCRNASDPNDAWDVEANVDIYLLELETRREVQVTSLPGQELNPSIVGRNVYFVAEDAIGQQAVFEVNLDDAGLL